MKCRMSTEALHTVAMLRTLHFTSRLEATSYLLLITATIVKYAADNPAGVSILGPVHGVLYLIYVCALMRWYDHLGWSFSKAVLAAALGALPFGGFHVGRTWLPKPIPQKA
jgi:integral membrane protein